VPDIFPIADSTDSSAICNAHAFKPATKQVLGAAEL
jgi:hypothetical protein